MESTRARDKGLDEDKEEWKGLAEEVPSRYTVVSVVEWRYVLRTQGSTAVSRKVPDVRTFVLYHGRRGSPERIWALLVIYKTYPSAPTYTQ